MNLFAGVEAAYQIEIAPASFIPKLELAASSGWKMNLKKPGPISRIRNWTCPPRSAVRTVFQLRPERKSSFYIIINTTFIRLPVLLYGDSGITVLSGNVFLPAYRFPVGYGKDPQPVYTVEIRTVYRFRPWTCLVSRRTFPQVAHFLWGWFLVDNH